MGYRLEKQIMGGNNVEVVPLNHFSMKSFSNSARKPKKSVKICIKAVKIPVNIKIKD